MNDLANLRLQLIAIGYVENRRVLMYKENKLVKASVIKTTEWLDCYDPTIPRRCWHIINDIITVPSCAQCNSYLKWWKSDGYRTFCSIKCALNSDSVKNKRKDTVLNVYGVDNVSKSQKVKDIRHSTNVERYGEDYYKVFNDMGALALNTKFGVDNVGELNKLPEIRERIKNTCLARYGVSTNLLLPSINDTFIERYGINKMEYIRKVCRAKNVRLYADEFHQLKTVSARKSSADLQRMQAFENRLVDNAVATPMFDAGEYLGVAHRQELLWKCKKCEIEFPDRLHNGRTLPLCKNCKPYFNKLEESIAQILKQNSDVVLFNNRSLLKNLELDFFIPSKRMAFECNGTYWHSENAGKNKNYHLNKFKRAAEHGIRLFYIWEHEFGNNPDLVKSFVMSKFGKFEKTVYARQCDIREVSKEEENQFLKDNHFQGACASKVRYGLYHQNQLVAIMTFGKPRFNNTAEYELIRFCNARFTNVVGGYQRLFKRFDIDKSYPSVISYCDISKFSGNMYKTLGFENIHDSPPNFYYTRDYKTIYHRMKFQKYKLKRILPNYDDTLTAWENMKLHKWNRIWDCGNETYLRKGTNDSI